MAIYRNFGRKLCKIYLIKIPKNLRLNLIDIFKNKRHQHDFKYNINIKSFCIFIINGINHIFQLFLHHQIQI